MNQCCENNTSAIEALRGRQRATLNIVLGINSVMFVLVLGAGLLAGSTALQSDALDNLGDALTYGLSLYAVAGSPRSKAAVSLLKGTLILAAGLFVLGQIAFKLAVPEVPTFEAMTAMGLLEIVANGACVGLLWKHRQEDINMSSVWVCSRNDIASNIGVLAAATGVWFTGSGWPDLLVGFALAALFVRSGVGILSRAFAGIRRPTPAEEGASAKFNLFRR